MRSRLLTFAVLGSALAAALSGAAPAKAEESRQCRDRADVLKHLGAKYKEAPVAVGVTSTGGLIEVLSSGEDGTWTIIVTAPTGLSCLMAAGEGWTPLVAQALDKPEA
jgi:hypothetical protein